MHRHAVEEEQHAKRPGDDVETAAAMTRRLRAAGVAAGVADDLVAKFPVQRVADALEVLPARRCSNAAGWLVRAISDAWPLHDEAERIRAAHAQRAQRETTEQAARAGQEDRDRRLAGWAAATNDALTDAQLAAAVEQVTRPVEGLDRRSTPVAVSQLLAWAITTAANAPLEPLRAALDHALREHTTETDRTAITQPDDIPEPPATNTDAEAFRRRVHHAINDFEAQRAPRQPKLEGGSDAP